jgi:hypothetical protein
MLDREPLSAPHEHRLAQNQTEIQSKTGGAYWQNLIYNESIVFPNSLKVR